MTATSFHSSELLRKHTVMFAGTTWRNTTRITGKFIRKTMTKRKLFNYQSHPVLHAGIARALWKRLCFLSSLGGVMFRFSHTAISLATDTRVLFFSPSQAQDASRVTGEERGKLLTCQKFVMMLSGLILINTSECFVLCRSFYCHS